MNRDTKKRVVAALLSGEFFFLSTSIWYCISVCDWIMKRFRRNFFLWLSINTIILRNLHLLWRFFETYVYRLLESSWIFNKLSKSVNMYVRYYTISIMLILKRIWNLFLRTFKISRNGNSYGGTGDGAELLPLAVPIRDTPGHTLRLQVIFGKYL